MSDGGNGISAARPQTIRPTPEDQDLLQERLFDMHVTLPLEANREEENKEEDAEDDDEMNSDSASLSADQSGSGDNGESSLSNSDSASLSINSATTGGSDTIDTIDNGEDLMDLENGSLPCYDHQLYASPAACFRLTEEEQQQLYRWDAAMNRNHHVPALVAPVASSTNTPSSLPSPAATATNVTTEGEHPRHSASSVVTGSPTNSTDNETEAEELSNSSLGEGTRAWPVKEG